MRHILLSLILILVASGFVFAEPTSSIETNFYVSNISSDLSEQGIFSVTGNKDFSISYWIYIIIIAVIIFILRKILKGKRKVKGKKRKNSRRKK